MTKSPACLLPRDRDQLRAQRSLIEYETALFLLLEKWNGIRPNWILVWHNLTMKMERELEVYDSTAKEVDWRRQERPGTTEKDACLKSLKDCTTDQYV